MLNVGYAIAGGVFMVGMALFAFLKGGTREKIGAGVYIAAWFASLIAQENLGFRDWPYGLFAIDTATLVALVAIAWRYPHSWPTWAAGLQLIAVMGHVMIMTTNQAPLTSIYTAMNLIGYLIILCIGVGTFYVWQERKAAAEYAQRTAR
jgi:hypothetical protein